MFIKKGIKAFKIRFHNFKKHFLESLGISLYSKPAFNNIDEKLEKYLPKSGFFVEAGAFDGFIESNTYYLEKIKGWKGVLIEPVIGNFKACRKNRPKSEVFNCGLVSSNYAQKTISFRYGGLMTSVDDLHSDESSKQELISKLSKYVDPIELEVKARTLTSVLDECSFSKFDFLSLDVEGYELEVLKGLDLNKYCPSFLLIECRDKNSRCAIEEYILDKYKFVEQLSHRDYLYKAI